MGHLVWMAGEFWDEFPTCDDVVGIREWRWPVFFPLGGALRRKLVDRVCRIDVPPALAPFPTMRGGGQGQPWMEYSKGELEGLGPRTSNRDLPVIMIVNDTMLKEMLVVGWKPSDDW
jgi:hypothetical protein